MKRMGERFPQITKLHRLSQAIRVRPPAIYCWKMTGSATIGQFRNVTALPQDGRWNSTVPLPLRFRRYSTKLAVAIRQHVPPPLQGPKS